MSAQSATPSKTKQTHPTNEHSIWPGAFGIYKTSKEAVMVNLKTIILLYVIYFGFTIFLSILFEILKLPEGFEVFLSQVGSTLLGVLATGASTALWLAGFKKQKMTVSESINVGVEYFLPILLVSILVGLATVGSLLLFIIPAFFIVPRLVLVSYLVIDKDMSPIDAFKASWDMSKGHVGKVYGILGANIAMALLMITIIGIPFAIYFLFMYSAATAVLYTYISSSKKIHKTAS